MNENAICSYHAKSIQVPVTGLMLSLTKTTLSFEDGENQPFMPIPSCY